MTEKPNIVLIVFDTLRGDYFQKYLDNNPNFSEKLSDFINFENAYSPSPWTLPSHFSLFTGLYPSEHGVHEDQKSEMEQIFSRALDYSGNFLTKLAMLYGYRTIGISANPMISNLTGFESKFNEFYNVNIGNISGLENVKNANSRYKIIRFVKTSLISDFRGYPVNKGYNIISSLFNKIDFSSSFFTFINAMEMHDPYFKNIFHIHENNKILRDVFGIKPLSKNKLTKLQNIYYSQLTKIESIILNVINTLKYENKFDNSVIIITADHGQALKEHGYYGHGTFLFDELIHIPMLIKFPKTFKKRFDSKTYINLVDLYDILYQFITNDYNKYNPYYREETFSESFGLQYSKSIFQTLINKPVELNLYKKINVPRKAIIKNGKKLTLNSNSDLEECSNFIESPESSLKTSLIKELLGDLEIFNIDKNFKIDENLILNKMEVRNE